MRFRRIFNVMKKAEKKFCCKVKPSKFAAVITFKKNQYEQS